jgi:hypothetical protein
VRSAVLLMNTTLHKLGERSQSQTIPYDKAPLFPTGNQRLYLGLTRAQIHQERMIRDAEEADPGVFAAPWMKQQAGRPPIWFQ